MFHVKREYLTKCVEGFAKFGEGKSKSLGRKFKARGSEIQGSFFRESGLFKGLRANLSDSLLGGRRQGAWTCEDAPPRHLATGMEPRLLRKRRPAIHARLASSLAAFWGTKSNDSMDLENRKHKSGSFRVSRWHGPCRSQADALGRSHKSSRAPFAPWRLLPIADKAHTREVLFKPIPKRKPGQANPSSAKPSQANPNKNA